ncbi:hypothetical protein ISS85_05375 [Candidatus Microgenomates bacterium]|nr:hypothetical protein [Candidatus Microgenomates bacterium]
MKKQFSHYLPYLLVLLIVGFNLWLYFPELSIKSDPNDNIFQFALIDQVNEVWNESAQLCQGNRVTCYMLQVTRLLDHWVPQWAQGFPLPFYYSHLPQVAITASYRFFKFIISQLSIINYQLSIYYYFNLIKYLALCLLPISFYIAGRNFNFSPFASALTALFASQISTDGLYGIDPPSYLWRGYGLSSQLFAIFFLPLAISYVFKALNNFPRSKLIRKKASLFKPILFLWLTSEAHLGIGLIAFLSGLVLIFQDFDLKNIFQRAQRLILIYAITLFFLAYHIVPFFYYNQYHNISFWDPIWKFNSFGIQEVSRMFLNGELFDFGRAPIITILALIGFCTALVSFSLKKLNDRHPKPTRHPELVSGSKSQLLKIPNQVRNDNNLFPFALLFLFWLLLFFGSKTWGPLLNMMPGIRNFHQHRFLLGVQLSGIFLAAIGAEVLIKILISFISLISPIGQIGSIKDLIKGLALNNGVVILLLITVLFPLFPQTLRYAQHNTFLIKTANQRFNNDWPDFEKLLTTLNRLPKGRIYAGRPGNWGREFKIGDTQLYMALSVRGFPIIGFLPETWSHNSDTEQFFDENRLAHYQLYNIRYVVAPTENSFPEFVILVEEFDGFNLYEIKTNAYFSLGTKNISVSSKKDNFSNLVHLWQISSLVEELSFPTLSFENTKNNTITMLDEVTYQINGEKKTNNIFSHNPFFAPSSSPSGKIINEKVSSQQYQADVIVEPSCQDCVLIFKMTYHPNWQFHLDGKKINQQIFFPFFQGIEISPGEHEITAIYEPNKTRVNLLILELIVLIGLFLKRKQLKKSLS